MNRVLDWNAQTIQHACGQFVRDQAGVWHQVRCEEAGWQVGFLHRLDLEEVCRLLNEAQAWLPQPLVADGCACSRVRAEPENPAQESEDVD